MELKFVLESLLFSAQKPLSARELRELLAESAEMEDAGEAVKAFRKVRDELVVAVLEELAQEHQAAGRSFRLVCVADAWQFVNQPEYAPWIKALVGQKARAPRLSQPALETLAIIAYRQPVTRAEVEQVRGVTIDGVMQTLVERELVEQVGRADIPGRPMTYGTTALFLEYFGIRNLEELPAADELRRLSVTRPESLTTVDPGLATAPPDQLQLPKVDPSSETDSAAPASPAVEQTHEHS